MSNENQPNNDKMSIEKIDGGLIQIRKGFSELRSSDVIQMEVLDMFNTDLYKLEQRYADIKDAFK